MKNLLINFKAIDEVLGYILNFLTTNESKEVLSKKI